MSPAGALTNELGVSPALAVFEAFSAAWASSSLLPSLLARALAMIAPLTWSGVHVGCTSSRSAAAPATIGAESDVPPAGMYSPLRTHVGQRLAKALPGASGPTMCAPGAAISGLAKPSWVTPRLDQLASRSSRVSLEPWSSTAPTVIAYGSLPGA